MGTTLLLDINFKHQAKRINKDTREWTTQATSFLKQPFHTKKNTIWQSTKYREELRCPLHFTVIDRNCNLCYQAVKLPSRVDGYTASHKPINKIL